MRFLSRGKSTLCIRLSHIFSDELTRRLDMATLTTVAKRERIEDLAITTRRKWLKKEAQQRVARAQH